MPLGNYSLTHSLTHSIASPFRSTARPARHSTPWETVVPTLRPGRVTAGLPRPSDWRSYTAPAGACAARPGDRLMAAEATPSLPFIYLHFRVDQCRLESIAVGLTVIFTLPPEGCEVLRSEGLYVCLSVRWHISKTIYRNFTKFSVHVDCGRGSSNLSSSDDNAILNWTQRASMDAGVKTPQCPHLSSHFCISSTTINLIRVLICHRFQSGQP